MTQNTAFQNQPIKVLLFVQKVIIKRCQVVDQNVWIEVPEKIYMWQVL